MKRRLLSYARRATLLLGIAGMLPLNATRAQEPALDKGITRERAELAAGKRMAILVGAQDYDALPKLRFCHSDVKLLEKTLREDCKFDRVITMTDEAAEKRYRPTRSSLIRELGVWLDLANKSDYSQVLVYFSGHGYRGHDEQLYFAPPDCDPNNLEETCLPQAYVRKKLDACDRVKVKLLILDTCHAGETKAASEGVTSEELAAVFKNAKGLYTMASCRGEEVSLEWPAKRQGLFTYWLAEGLKGAADRDGDKLVDTSELYKFTYNQVLETSIELGRVQNVVERPSDDWQGIAVLARVERPTSDGLTEPRVAPLSESDTASGMRPYVGTIPDFDSTSEGYAVLGVTRGGPADKGGLQGGDVIVKFGESNISSLEDFDIAVRKFKAGDKVKVVVIRDTEAVELEIVLDPPKSDSPADKPPVEPAVTTQPDEDVAHIPYNVHVELTISIDASVPKDARLYVRCNGSEIEVTRNSPKIVSYDSESSPPEFYTGDPTLGSDGWKQFDPNRNFIRRADRESYDVRFILGRSDSSKRVWHWITPERP